MKTQSFTTKKGDKGEKYLLENGDIVEFVYSETLIMDKGGIENYGAKVIHEDEEKFINLTTGQNKALARHGDLAGKKFKVEPYKNKFGTFLTLKPYIEKKNMKK